MTVLQLSGGEQRRGPKGYPVLGSTFDWIRDPKEFSLKIYEEYGPVVNVNYFFKNVTFLLGVEANERVLLDRDDEFSNQRGWAQVSRLFEGGLMLMDFNAHRLNRRVIQRAFTHSNLENYVASLRRIVEEQVSLWSGYQDFTAYQRIKLLMLQTAASTFVGIKDPIECAQLNAELICMLKAAVAVLQANIPGTQFWKGMRSRKYLKDYMGKQVEERRQEGGKDLFSQLCIESAMPDSNLNNDEVVEHMIFLVMAAHDTTSSLLSSLTMKLAENQEWQDKVRAELCSLEEDYSIRDLEKAPITEAVVNETLRMHPPVPDIPRMTTKEVSILDRTLPPDSRIVVSVGFTHYYRGYWKDPYIFNPNRFLTRTESFESRFKWLPFGGGAHKCIGLHFSYLQSKVFLRALLSRFRVVPATDDKVEWVHIPFPRPKQSIKLIPLAETMRRSLS